jgi:FKBP-type peptidyl-prolyl cis-trans isomerase
MDKDYTTAVRGGWSGTGLHPFNPRKVLDKMPGEKVDVASDVQRALLKQLQGMRYNPSATTRATQPRKKDKLPAGEAYTCPAEVEASDHSDDDSDDDSDDSDRERSRQVRDFLQRVNRNRRPLDPDSDSEKEDDPEEIEIEQEQDEIEQEQDEREQEEDEREQEEDESEQEQDEREQEEPEEELEQQQIRKGRSSKQQQQQQLRLVPGSYVVVVYDGDWYVGQVREKEGEAEADMREEYVLVDFMKRTAKNQLEWPKKLDMLNVLLEDVLFSCQSPTLVHASSSGRTTTCQLSKEDLNKAKKLFKLYKAFYPTEKLFILFLFSKVQVQYRTVGR